MLLLTLAEVGFPFVSSDYTLIHLVLTALLFLSAGGKQPAQNTLCVLLALLFIPINWWAHTYYMSHYAMILNAGSVLRPLVIILLLAVLMRDFNYARLKEGIKTYIRPK